MVFGGLVVPLPVPGVWFPPCGVVFVTPGAGNDNPVPGLPPMARCICICIRIISGFRSRRRISGLRIISASMGLLRNMGFWVNISMTAGLFMASFICERNIGLSIISRSCSGAGGGPIYGKVSKGFHRYGYSHVKNNENTTYPSIWAKRVHTRQPMESSVSCTRQSS